MPAAPATLRRRSPPNRHRKYVISRATTPTFRAPRRPAPAGAGAAVATRGPAMDPIDTATTLPAATSPGAADAAPDLVPDYLRETYAWAYLNPRSVRLLDRPLVVQTILWGQFRRLVRAALAELRPGWHVLQPACVYADLSPRLAAHLGPEGHLQVSDVAPIQIANTRRKLLDYPNTRLLLRDAADHPPGAFDGVVCFFLLHEVPAGRRRGIVTNLLRTLKPGGKAVFVDYHRPRWWHPLKPVTGLVFATLEPFAKGLWHEEIAAMADAADDFRWTKRTRFGGLFQTVTAEPR